MRGEKMRRPQRGQLQILVRSPDPINSMRTADTKVWALGFTGAFGVLGFLDFGGRVFPELFQHLVNGSFQLGIATASHQPGIIDDLNLRIDAMALDDPFALGIVDAEQNGLAVGIPAQDAVGRVVMRETFRQAAAGGNHINVDVAVVVATESQERAIGGKPREHLLAAGRAERTAVPPVFGAIQMSPA